MSSVCKEITVYVLDTMIRARTTEQENLRYDRAAINEAAQTYARSRRREDLETLCEAAAPYVRAITCTRFKKKIKKYGWDDILSGAYGGLLNAARLYRPSKGEFTYYLNVSVKFGVIEFLRSQRKTYGWIPRGYLSLLKKVQPVLEQVGSSGLHGRDAAVLAEETGLSEKSIGSALFYKSTVSMSTPTTASDRTLEQTLACGDRWDDPTYGTEIRDLVEKVWEQCEGRDGKMMHLHFIDGLKMKEIGKLFGISESRVPQIITRAIEKLQQNASLAEQARSLLGT